MVSDLFVCRAMAVLLLCCLLVVAVPAAAQMAPLADTPSATADDPWEPFNRRVHNFNERADTWVIKPAAQGYRAATPGWLRGMVGRFFSNLHDFRSGVHGVLQWRWRDAGHNFGRFGLNSTLGVAGLFDVASSVDLERNRQDLGLTLGRWGVPEGPYLVLPFLGPSTVRDGLAIYPDTWLLPERYIMTGMNTEARVGLAAIYVLNVRESLLDLERGLTGDRYILMRDFYLSGRRERDADEDFGFGDDLDDWDDDDW